VRCRPGCLNERVSPPPPDAGGPQVSRFHDGQLTRWPADAGNPDSAMYRLDALGVHVSVRTHGGCVRVSLGRAADSRPGERMPLQVEVDGHRAITYE
jgi:hypothetical protein